METKEKESMSNSLFGSEIEIQGNCTKCTM